MRHLIALLLLANPAAAEVYRCQAPGGGVTFSDQPCPGQRSQTLDVEPSVIDMTEARQGAEAREQERQKAKAEQAAIESLKPPPGTGKTRACLDAKAARQTDKNPEAPAHALLAARERLFCSLRAEPIPGCLAAMQQFEAVALAGATAQTLVPELKNIDEACGRPLPPPPEPRRPPYHPKPKCAEAGDGQPCPAPADPANATPPLKFCIEEADGRLDCHP